MKNNLGKIESDLFLDHAKYIKDQEYEAARNLLNKSDAVIDFEKMGAFVQQAYDRVVDMFEFKDFNCCQRLIMVGCGPFPMTVLHILNKFPNIVIDAIDIDCGVMDTAQKITDKCLSNHKASFILSSGLDYDYAKADIIYVANLVRPKQQVLKRIANTAKSGALIVLREPTQKGLAYSESGIESIDKSFSIEGTGEDSEIFYSRHVFLRRL